MSESSGLRMDQGKSPVVDGCFRYFPRALLAVAMVSKSGADKYQVELKDKAWLAYTESDILNSEGRHMLKEAIEGKYDSDSNLLHKAHKAWNALADLEKELMKGTELKDRASIPPRAAPAPSAPAKGKGFKNKDWDGWVTVNQYDLICDNCGTRLGLHFNTACCLGY